MKERPAIRSPRNTIPQRPRKLIIIAEVDDSTFGQIVDILRQQEAPPERLKQ